MVFDHFIEHAAATQGDRLIIGAPFQVHGAMTLHFWENAEILKKFYCKLFKVSKAKFENGVALFNTIDYYLVVSKPFLKLLSGPDYSLAENYWKSIEAIIASENEKKPNHDWANLYHALINYVSLIGSILHQLDDAKKQDLNILEPLFEKSAAPFTVPLLFCGVNTAMREIFTCFQFDGWNVQDSCHEYLSNSSSIATKTMLSSAASVGVSVLNPLAGLTILGITGPAALKARKDNRNQYRLIFQHCYWYMILLSCYSRYYYDANSSAQP